MRIVIDLQGVQGTSRYRGIGRYSLSLALAMARNRGSHEILIALNGLFPESIEPIRAAFEGLLPQENIRIWNVTGPVSPLDPANSWRGQTAELVREAFLVSLRPDIVHITSLFEGFVDDAVYSIGLNPAQIPTAVTLYDLIPLIQSDNYLKPNPIYEVFYRKKLSYLKKAAIYLAISNSSRQEAIDYLDATDIQSVNIAAAADVNFKLLSISTAKKNAILQRFGLVRPFLMYSGATDERKNHLRLIKAFSLLSPTLKSNYQLAIVGGLPIEHKEKFHAYAAMCGLKPSDVIVTDRVTDEELAQLYNICHLFVFPSWHEGFGLPALEAMSCGAPVIGANTTSLPEVIGRPDALFDPFNEESIAQKITEVLTDDDLRADLARHGLKHAENFSWNQSARKAITAFEKYQAKQPQDSFQSHSLPSNRPKLAFVSPLPPERSGISDYSAELLPALSRHYDIDVIVTQKIITDSWIIENCAIRNVSWFIENSHLYDRIIYQFGNSHFHEHMFGLLAKIPGTVVLHDFFLSGIVAHMDVHGISPHGWNRELYYSHGYRAVQEHSHSKNWDDEIFKYPCNKTVLDNAQGVIVHSENSRLLATHWFGENFATDWSVIPLLRNPEVEQGRKAARLALGISADTFMVCTFGILHPTKQNQRLLNAWLASSLSKNEQCLLVFVGENHGGDYGEELITTIHANSLADRIQITGWTETTEFRQYLAAADVGVQLRTLSRGETSAAVLDCMNYGLPTIVNANGSMADLPADAVWMLPDLYEDIELSQALETLWKDELKRNKLGSRARETILTKHAPSSCAQKYAHSIEKYFEQAQRGKEGLAKTIAKIDKSPTGDHEWIALAQSIAQNEPIAEIRQLLVDVSALVKQDLKSGIERVVRSALAELLNNPPEGFRVEPIYATENETGYRYARKFTLRFLNCSDESLEDEIVEAFSRDVFLGLDLQQYIIAQQNIHYQKWRRVGVLVYFVVYDLLPILRPDVFPEGASSMHASWLSTVQQADGAVCISRSVADEMAEWLSVYGTARARKFNIGWFHLGADVNNSIPTAGLPKDADKVLTTISSRPTFLMVGTVEPRKGYMQALSAFEKLWAQGVDVNLVIVGYEGWKGLPERQRRTIPLTVYSLLNHPQHNQRLIWLQGISDEYLEGIYASSTCLIAGSEGEGFGLPLIEAAQHKLSIIARDIPVFREVAGQHAFYFSGSSAEDLADGIVEWLRLDKAGLAPKSDNMPWSTWKKSTQNLMDVMLNSKWYQQWMPDDVQRFRGNNTRLHTEVGLRTGCDIESSRQAGYLVFGPYIPLQSGCYMVTIRGVVGENGAAGSHMDVAVNGGSRILGVSGLTKPDENGNLVALLISLDTPCTDFEIRVWVSSDCDLCVSAIEIAPWPAEQVTGKTSTNEITGSDSSCQNAVLMEPAEQPQGAQELSVASATDKPMPHSTHIDSNLLHQEFSGPSLVVQSAVDMFSGNFEVIADYTDVVAVVQAPEVEIRSARAPILNDPSESRVLSRPSPFKNERKLSSAERNRAKTERKKQR
jgi:glycosyltransferase involved in cell wall biosynthesis